MTDRFHGYSEGLLTAAFGLAILGAEMVDILFRAVGFLGVLLGIAFSTTRFVWDMEDRRDRRRVNRAPLVFRPEVEIEDHRP
jgi:hypothetical protein